MNRDNIWDGFTKLFPEHVDAVESFKKVGSKTLKLKMKTNDGSDKYFYFLYNDPWDWTYGSKVWRTKPKKQVKNNIDEVIKEAENNGNSDITSVQNG